MLETIGIFVAKSLASYGFNKGLAKVFKDRKSFVNRLAQVINKTIDQYKKESPIVDKDGKFAFYDFQILLEELLKFRFFSKDGYRLSDDIITEALRDNPKIIPPGKNQLERFLEVFEQNIKADEELKKLEIDENYKAEIFSISDRIDQLLDKLTGVKPFPKELTALTPIAKKDIIGRGKDLQTLRQKLLEDKETALINGMGGIGKTTLAAVYVHEFYDEYDHIVWLTLENTLEEAIASNYALIENLKLKAVPANEQFESCLNILRGIEPRKPKLLVLDNAKENLAQHFDKLPKAPGWHLLVTSRQRIQRFHIVDLDFLSETEAIELFKKYNTQFSDEQIKGIVSLVERHTLTIEILARSASRNHWHFEQVEHALAIDAKANIAVPHSDQKVERIKTYLGSIFDLSNLNEQEIYILQQFTALPSQWLQYGFLISLLQVDKLEWQDEFAGSLEGLYENGFILKDLESDSYKMHAILVEALEGQLDLKMETVKLLLEKVTDIFRIYHAKDNPLDKFQYIPFGDVLIKQLPENSVEKAKLQSALAYAYENLGYYEKARELYETALASALANLDEKHPRVARRQAYLAHVYIQLGDYEKAQELYETALTSAIANFGEKHPKVAKRQIYLARVYRKLGNYEKARNLVELASTSDLANSGEKYPKESSFLPNLAVQYYKLGDYEKARDLFETALTSALANFDEKHPKVARRQIWLARVYIELGDYVKAQDLLESTLTSDLANFGGKHPEVVSFHTYLAGVYYKLGDYEKARRLFERILNINIEIYDKNHPYIAESQLNLAHVYIDLGLKDKARDLLESALASDLANFGEKYPEVERCQTNLATVYIQLGDYEKAQELYEAALTSALANFGEKHPNVAMGRSNLATVYSDLGDYEKAQDLLEAALKSDLGSFGEKHPNIADRQLNLAFIYLKMGHKKEARLLWESAYKILLNAFGEGHPYTKIVKEFLDNII
ncbi:tetratricopeptide repeat protein [bacterium]|nr:tetratricopeptide repeat protein [bacterium]